MLVNFLCNMPRMLHNYKPHATRDGRKWKKRAMAVLTKAVFYVCFVAGLGSYVQASKAVYSWLLTIVSSLCCATATHEMACLRTRVLNIQEYVSYILDRNVGCEGRFMSTYKTNLHKGNSYLLVESFIGPDCIYTYFLLIHSYFCTVWRNSSE